LMYCGYSIRDDDSMLSIHGANNRRGKRLAQQLAEHQP
jgi:hypothetical protein